MNNFSTLVKEVVDEPKPVVKEGESKTIDSVVTKTKTDLEPPLDAYSEVKGIPYTVKYFDIDYWKELTPELDKQGVFGKVKDIEKFVKDEIKHKNFNNSVESYKEIMDKIKLTLGVNKNEDTESALSRIHAYIKMLAKQRAIQKDLSEMIYGKFQD